MFFSSAYTLHISHLDWFSPQNEKVLGSHHHKAHELMAQNLLNLISLEKTNESTLTFTFTMVQPQTLHPRDSKLTCFVHFSGHKVQDHTVISTLQCISTSVY